MRNKEEKEFFDLLFYFIPQKKEKNNTREAEIGSQKTTQSTGEKRTRIEIRKKRKQKNDQEFL